jgi:transcriptional regulator with XRE-family HTH domain
MTIRGAPVSPTVRRRRLALELRRLREAAGLTCDEVAGRLECSASKISRVETGRVSVSPRDVRDMLEIYNAADEQRDGLVQLARESRQKGWWHAYGDTVQPHLATYLGLESAASEMRIYNLSRIQALLQTEDYARAVFSAARVGRAHPGTERSVELLMESQRQAMARPLRLWAVLDEAVLRHQVGGRAVVRGQIEHLLELSTRAGMFIQVMPYASGPQIAMDVSFAIMTFPDPADPGIVCIGYPTGLLWIEDLTEVSQYNRLFNHLQAAALSFENSAAFMASVLKEM